MYWFEFGGAHDRAGLLYASVEDRIDRAFLGEQWLRRRYGGNRTVEVRCALHELQTVQIDGVHTVGGSRKRVIAETSLPVDWFRGRIDGLLGLRMMGAAVRSLTAIGSAVGIGPCPLRSPGRAGRKAFDFDLFGSGGAFSADQSVARLLAGAPRDALLLVAGSEERGDRRWQQDVVRRLGAARFEHRDDEGGGPVWTAPLPE